MHPFAYDRFQEEAIAAIRQGRSVFVSAPTGAGKTVIAEVAMEEALRSGGMAIYTSPIKALSNQKFRDLYALYGEKVGILTGDVTVNPEAPILIMTTEIYRNSLFEENRRFAQARWIIFDEVHYLDDPERGTVWEESLLFTPRETEILALSATIPNAKELAAWIEKIHGRPVKVVEESHRPVPLRFAFQCHDTLFPSLEDLKIQGYRQRHGRSNRADHLIQRIQAEGNLPCLYFTFSRRRAEDLAWEFSGLNLLHPSYRQRLLKEFDRLCGQFQISHERSAWEMRERIAQGVAYHHAGLLPSLKEVVERLFAGRWIKVIVTTETFALGVNMPAKSVVLDTLTRRADRPWPAFQKARDRERFPRTLIRVREFLQMAGRAGRRGMDRQGFVYLRVNPWEAPSEQVSKLISGRPEKVVSRFNTAYATLLNLYSLYGTELLSFYPKSFHAFGATAIQKRELQGLLEGKLTLLKNLGYLTSEGLTPKGKFALPLFGYELILSELFVRGFLDPLDLTDLGILLLALVYEPRRGIPRIKIPRRVRRLKERAEELLKEIHRKERELRITPLSKGASFQISGAMERWIQGASFEKAVSAGNLDEGELIRYFRMTIQLLRTLVTASAPGPLKENLETLLKRINRDPVDAEAELRRSL